MSTANLPWPVPEPAWPQQVAGTWEPEDPPWWPLLTTSDQWCSPLEWPDELVLVVVARHEDEVLAHIDVARCREWATSNPDRAEAVAVYLPPVGEEIPPGAKAAIIAAIEMAKELHLPRTFRRLPTSWRVRIPPTSPVVTKW